MNVKPICLLAGIFSILNTIQFLILDLNEVTIIGYENGYDIYRNVSGFANWVLTNKKSISMGLSGVTVLVSAMLLYCIHLSFYQGLLCYALWIVCYEATSLSTVLLLNSIRKKRFKELGYVHLALQISRMLLHFFSLPFVLKHTYHLYPKSFSKRSRRRRSSLSTLDSWSHVGPGTMYRKLN